jgi:hypothetical protein
MPLAEAARLAHLSPVTLRKAAARGRLPAKKLAGQWFTSGEWLTQYLATRRTRGRPARKKGTLAMRFRISEVSRPWA